MREIGICKVRGNGIYADLESGKRHLKYHAAVPVDVYVVRGGGDRWHNRSACHPFRYVELIGFPGTPPPETVTGLVMHNDLGRTGSFSSSDETLNEVYEAADRSADYCTHGHVNDNTGAEKANWLTPGLNQEVASSPRSKLLRHRPGTSARLQLNIQPEQILTNVEM